MLRALLFGFLLVLPLLSFAEQSFTDVSSSREEYAAIEDLRDRGVFEGRPDGTFGPDDFVNRAEAITVVVRAVANVRNLPAYSSCFPDVHGDHWYVQPVCYAEDLGWISGYPDGTFQPVRTVARGEFLKILLNAYGVDVDELTPFSAPIAPDVQNADEWFFTYLRYAVASSMTSADSFGNLNPGSALTRGQVAMLIHRFLLFREGERDQNLLTNAEKDIRSFFAALDDLNLSHARYALSRIQLSVWSAAQRIPGSNVVKATGEISNGLSSLLASYRSVQEGDLDSGLSQAQTAYGKADAADTFGPNVKVYTDRIRTHAHDLAEDIRAHQK